MEDNPTIITVTIGSTSGSVTPSSATTNEGDVVTWEPTGGTILAISPATGSSNMFSSGPTQIANSNNWTATAGTTAGTETYNVEVQPTIGNSYWIDPSMKINN